jgi:hypothetical protein
MHVFLCVYVYVRVVALCVCGWGCRCVTHILLEHTVCTLWIVKVISVAQCPFLSF